MMDEQLSNAIESTRGAHAIPTHASRLWSAEKSVVGVHRSLRWCAAGIPTVCLCFLLVGQALAATSFAKTKVGWKDTWNNGDPAIATTTTSTKTFLHAIFMSDNWKGTGSFTFDGSGRYLSPYY